MISHQVPGRRCLALLASVALASTAVQAQTAPQTPPTATNSDKKDEAILLTPFQVNTAKDVGYAAGNTLSGGRVDTPLAITPASISVITKEFLQDFNINDVNQAAAWTIAMDPPTGGESGPFGGNRFQANFRGAGNGANYPSRNGALEYFVADSYNTERMEFSRGPNALMFGDAGPGGVQGSSSKQARLNNRSSQVSLQVDSYSGYRSTLDTNFGTDRFALRVNGLYQNQMSYQDASDFKQQAISVAATYKVADNTQIRAEFERSAEWNAQFRKTYGENASIWNRSTVNNDNSALLANNSTDLNLAGLEQIRSGNQANDAYLVYNFGAGALFNYQGNQYRTRGLGYQIPWGGRPDLPTNFKPGVDKSFNLGPADIIADRDLNRRAINIDHRFTPDLFLELSWITSDIDPVALYQNGPPNDYRIDVNRLLPNGQPNPYFGKAYSDFGQNSQYQQNGVREYRFILNYQFAVPKWYDMKERVMLNGGWRQDLYEAWSRAWRWTNNPAQPDPTNGVNAINYRVYWDQPRQSIAPVLPPNVPGMTFRNVDFTFAADNDRRLTYGQIVSQTTFFQERLAVTLGFRRDKNEDDTQSNIGFDAANNYALIMGAQNPVTLKNEAGRHGKLTTFRNSRNAGIVAFPFPENLRMLRPFAVVANFSENFSIPSTGPNLITGQRPAPPVAKTTDFGVRYSLPNGVAYATLSHYNTTQTGNIQNFGNLGDTNNNNPGFRNIWRELGYTETNLSGDDFNYRDTNDRKLEGWEFEVTANPTRNLTLTANYSHPIVTTISDSPGRRAYYEANKAQFQAGANATSGTILNGHVIGNPAVIQTGITNIENSLNGFTPGTLTNGLERHRINVAGSYRFTEGVLRGVGVNAGVNYRGHKKIGSRDARLKFQTVNPTTAQTAEAAYDYLWADPTYQVAAGVNYTRRFGRYSARFQLNVTNLLNDDDPQWTSYGVINAGQLQGMPNSATSNGNALTVAGGNPRMQVVNGFTQFDPRKFTFTTTFTF